jgi:hypothetical protein
MRYPSLLPPEDQGLVVCEEGDLPPHQHFRAAEERKKYANCF